MTTYDSDNEQNLIGSILSEETLTKAQDSRHLFQNFQNGFMIPGNDHSKKINYYGRSNSGVYQTQNQLVKLEQMCASTELLTNSTDSYTFLQNTSRFQSKNNMGMPYDDDRSIDFETLFLTKDIAQLDLNQNDNLYEQKKFIDQKKNRSTKLRANQPGPLTIRHTSSWSEQITEISDDIQLSNELDQLLGNQLASRKIQKIFENGREDQKEQIFNRMERQCFQYSKDIFANYIIQRVLEKGSEQQQLRMFNKLRPQFSELAKNNFGCRVIQKILDCIQNQPDLQDQFLDQIRFQIKTLLYDVYGNYVILKCLDTIRKEKLEFMLPFIQEQTSYMVQQTYGCRIIQKVMELFNQNEVAKIVRQTISMCHILCHTEYACYQEWSARGTINVVWIDSDKYMHDESEQVWKVVCKSQQISNTVEKYIEQATQEALRELTSLFMKPTQQEPFFLTLATHPYGNYVFKKYLIVSDNETHEPVIQLLKYAPLYIHRIKSSEYGQRVYDVLEKIMIQY